MKQYSPSDSSTFEPFQSAPGRDSCFVTRQSVSEMPIKPIEENHRVQSEALGSFPDICNEFRDPDLDSDLRKVESRVSNNPYQSPVMYVDTSAMESEAEVVAVQESSANQMTAFAGGAALALAWNMVNQGLLIGDVVSVGVAASVLSYRMLQGGGRHSDDLQGEKGSGIFARLGEIASALRSHDGSGNFTGFVGGIWLFSASNLGVALTTAGHPAIGVPLFLLGAGSVGYITNRILSGNPETETC